VTSTASTTALSSSTLSRRPPGARAPRTAPEPSLCLGETLTELVERRRTADAVDLPTALSKKMSWVHGDAVLGAQAAVSNTTG